MPDPTVTSPVPAAPAAPTAAIPAAPVAPAVEPPPTEPPPSRTFTQEEVDKIVAKRLGKAERAWQRQNQSILETALSARVPTPAAPAPAPVADGEPDPTKFTDPAEYIRAVSRYEAQQLLTQSSEREQQSREQATAAERQGALQSAWQRQMDAALAKYDDFEDVALASDLPITPVMGEIIAESELGGELAYYLGKNRAEAIRIAGLSPARAAAELGKLEAKLAVAPAPPASSAPAPIEPVGNRAPAAADPDAMSTEEWLKWREADLKKKRA